jgi:hypothetical protein
VKDKATNREILESSTSIAEVMRKMKSRMELLDAEEARRKIEGIVDVDDENSSVNSTSVASYDVTDGYHVHRHSG